MTRMIICRKCGLEKSSGSLGLCQSCYIKQKPKVICPSCGKLQSFLIKGLCVNCRNHKIGKYQSMSENKSCSNYLGVVVTEKLLLKRFKNAKEMPHGNKGYDFTCDKGYKIDAKSSILRFDKTYPIYKKYWSFNTKKNKIADYFCCVGYDNREDLNVIKAWLIPSDAITTRGNVINDLEGFSVLKNKTEFWKQYEMDIDVLNDCCITMKEK